MNWWASPHTFRLFLFHPRMTVCWEIRGAGAIAYPPLLLWSGQAVRTANPQLWPAPSLNWPGRRLPFRRLSFLPYRTPRHLITTLCFEGNLGEFFTIFLGDEPSHPTLQQDYFSLGWVISKLTWQEQNQFRCLFVLAARYSQPSRSGRVPGRIWTGDPRIKSSLRLPTALQERLTTNVQRTKKCFSFSCAPLSTLRIYYSIKFRNYQIFCRLNFTQSTRQYRGQIQHHQRKQEYPQRFRW